MNAHTTWQARAGDLIGGPITQTADNCYAIATTRDFEMKLKMARRLPDDATLAIQEIVNLVPRKHLEVEKYRGALRSLPALADVWEKHGTVLAQWCPFTQVVHPSARKTVGRHRYIPGFVGVFEQAGFEDWFAEALQREMIKGPVTVCLPVYPSYESLSDPNFVYNPTSEEIIQHWCSPKICNHAMLATCSGHVNNIPVLRCQDSYGADWGDKGYVTVARDIVSHYISIDLD